MSARAASATRCTNGDVSGARLTTAVSHRSAAMAATAAAATLVRANPRVRRAELC